jgi:hypothetical protein
MNYRVVWLRKVVAALARSYLFARDTGRDAGAITRAMAEIEAGLERNPSSLGESRPEGHRLYIVNPITLGFEVFVEERVVVVTSVRYHPHD